MQTEQFVLAYGVEQDRLRAILPEGFVSLRPVLRFNAEIRDDRQGMLEYRTAVEKAGVRGWLCIAGWQDVPFHREGRTVTFRTPFLTLRFTGVGVEGGCPAEKDNAGCFYPDGAGMVLRPPECITAHKEFCDAVFRFSFTPGDAQGVSQGRTLPAVPTGVQKVYPRRPCTAESAAAIPCTQVLGAYTVRFDRQTPPA